jgi:hypothetical protein
VEGARFGAGTTFEIDSTDRELHYSGTGTVAGLNPQRFSLPLDISWLADDRVRGLLTGAFTFDGRGRTVDSLVLNTTADLENSTMAGASFPTAHVTMQMSDRTLDTAFAGSFEHLPGSLFVAKPELADSTLNGTADMRVTVVIPEVEPAKLEALSGTATLAPSTMAGLAVEKGQVDLTYANEVADIRQLSLTGPSIEGTAKGTLAIGDRVARVAAAIIGVDRFGQPRIVVCVDMHGRFEGQAHADEALLRRVAEAEPGDRKHLVGQLEDFGDLGDAVAQDADRAGAEPDGFGGEDAGLHDQRRVDRSVEKSFERAVVQCATP